MIVDSSALLAILKGEPDRDRISEAILLSSSVAVSAPTLLETAIVIEGRSDLDALLAEIEPQIVAFTAEQASLAREAFRRFGKGKHPARLNFGDCISYALAKESGEPLLFKGDDFSKTDIEAAPY